MKKASFSTLDSLAPQQVKIRKDAEFILEKDTVEKSMKELKLLSY